MTNGLPRNPGGYEFSRRMFLGGGTAALALGALVMAGCAPQSSSGSSLRVGWWGGDERNKATLDAIDIWKSNNPGTTVKGEYSDIGGYFDKLTTQFSGKSAPDVVQMNYTPELDSYASRKALLDLTRYVGDGLDLSILDDAGRQAGYIGETLYGVTLATMAPACIYAKSVIEPLGVTVPASWDWDAYGTVLNEIREASGGSLFGAEDSSNNTAVLDSFLLQRGYGGIFTDGKLSGSADDLVDWFAYWADLRATGAIVDAETAASATGGHPTNPVVTGAAAVGLQWNITLDVWRGLADTTFAYAAQPDGPAGSSPGNYLRPASLFVVSAASKNVDGAVAFINDFVNDAAELKALGLTRGVPSASQMSSIGTLTADQQALIDFSSTISSGPLAAVAPTIPAKAASAFADFSNVASEVAFGRTTPQKAGKTVYDSIQSALQAS